MNSQKTYLITGGAGFIGANFIKYLLEKYESSVNLIVLDKLTYAGNLKTIEKELDRINFIKGDICDKELVNNIFFKNGIDFVVNFAAETHVDRSIENSELFLKTNILGTHNLIENAKIHWEIGENQYKENKCFLQISTDEVYGSLDSEGYFTEKTPLNPRSPYSASKAGADLLVSSYVETYNFPAMISRCSNNYGPYQFPEKLIPLTIKNIMESKKIPIYGNGENVRDWIYVVDHCKAIDLVLEKGKIGEVYNIGGNSERRNIEVVKTVIDILKELKDFNEIDYSLIEYIKDRKGHDKRYAIDSTKIKNDLGWLPEMDFENGIRETINWYLNNEDWLNSVVSGEYEEYYKRIYGER